MYFLTPYSLHDQIFSSTALVAIFLSALLSLFIKIEVLFLPFLLNNGLKLELRYEELFYHATCRSLRSFSKLDCYSYDLHI